jgi:DNA-binding protein Fis
VLNLAEEDFEAYATEFCVTRFAHAINNNKAVYYIDFYSRALFLGSLLHLNLFSVMFQRSGSNITYLSLCSASFEEELSPQIIAAIKSMPNLEYLDLSGGCIGSKTCVEIIEALEKANNLISLNLSANSINYREDIARWKMSMMDSCSYKPPPQAVLANPALCNLISTKKNLRTLDLSSNRSINETDRTTIAEALKQSSSITELDLSRTDYIPNVIHSSFSTVRTLASTNRTSLKETQRNLIEFVLSIAVPVHGSLPKEIWEIILAQVEFPLLKQLSRTAADIFGVINSNLKSIREMIQDKTRFVFVFESKGRVKSVSLRKFDD